MDYYLFSRYMWRVLLCNCVMVFCLQTLILELMYFSVLKILNTYHNQPAYAHR